MGFWVNAISKDLDSFANVRASRGLTSSINLNDSKRYVAELKKSSKVLPDVKQNPEPTKFSTADAIYFRDLLQGWSSMAQEEPFATHELCTMAGAIGTALGAVVGSRPGLHPKAQNFVDQSQDLMSTFDSTMDAYVQLITEFIKEQAAQGNLRALKDFQREYGLTFLNIYVNNINSIPNVAKEILEATDYFDRDARFLNDSCILDWMFNSWSGNCSEMIKNIVDIFAENSDLFKDPEQRKQLEGGLFVLDNPWSTKPRIDEEAFRKLVSIYDKNGIELCEALKHIDNKFKTLKK